MKTINYERLKTKVYVTELSTKSTSFKYLIDNLTKIKEENPEIDSFNLYYSDCYYIEFFKTLIENDEDYEKRIKYEENAIKKYGGWSDSDYISMALRCVFEEVKPKPEPKPAKATIGTYQGNPTLSLPMGNKTFTFGKEKAKAILKYMEDIKNFVENN